MENVTFDDYIFRGNPMIFIFTAISVQAQDIPPEEVREEILKGWSIIDWSHPVLGGFFRLIKNIFYYNVKRKKFTVTT